ncbi:cleavage stimulation factor subunit 77 isoform X1 [Solanum tuberosum]|nr:PREDICTED: cleavage stimulation factor subunit 77 isoform X1 [Solanum tuberosum]XP_006356599.1 PREDICTED: cleavage stimulation factor subunit 77 isoform X1 [Solanum tuberosum]XP_006356600.1 PREDICTED: cleavage stimulation factor subunit 77 isoform X1 [Solanum tuberosum]XP_015168466.1 PREDICTED: cleavage stimulation factor subunit 77 isoform X1 [Solanum tuberosum]
MTDKYNVEAAEILANEALRSPISEAVPLYEQLLSTFPTAAKYWKQYVEAHMAVNNDDATKQIFSRCLLNCLQIPLWRCYIRFIRKVNDKRGNEGQEETRKAFDFMLNYVGADIASGPVWMEYIAFLRSLPAPTAQEESQRMTSVRKIYQRAIVTPTHHVEQLWRDYENFENSISRALAKGLVSEYQPKYNSARAVYRERKKYTDEIDWNMLAIPPSGSSKEEMQWMAWKKLLAFEKANPQRIDSASANKRIVFTYEQCLMYLYHYPDIWYEYATWHAKAGSVDSAIKVFQRALKALPDSEMLRYAYAELEESRGAIQASKKVYESLFGDGSNASALSHIQFIRFLRRSEGVEAARKYFVDARKSPNCTYHVYVAYAMMAFCLDKDAKMAHNVFEAGLKRFMHEPGYILEYADFLYRLNDDRNIRALFERALSSLPPEESVEVWKKFTQFEQTYGDLASMLKVEQRRKEALSRTGDDGASELESSLHDVVSRYSFMDLWPCSSNDLDHLARQEWLARNINKKPDKPTLGIEAGSADKTTSGVSSNTNPPAKVVYPDTSKMTVYDPRQIPGPAALAAPSASGTLPYSGPFSSNGPPNALNDILKSLPPAFAAFIANLPAVEGPSPDADFVISVCLQSNIPAATGKSGTASLPLQSGAAPSTSDLSDSSKFRPRDRQPGKRKDMDRQEDDESTTIQSQPLPRDLFKIRQLQKNRVGNSSRVTSSYTGSASYGSALSGDLSGSTS